MSFEMKDNGETQPGGEDFERRQPAGAGFAGSRCLVVFFAKSLLCESFSTIHVFKRVYQRSRLDTRAFILLR